MRYSCVLFAGCSTALSARGDGAVCEPGEALPTRCGVLRQLRPHLRQEDVGYQGNRYSCSCVRVSVADGRVHRSEWENSLANFLLRTASAGRANFQDLY